MYMRKKEKRYLGKREVVRNQLCMILFGFCARTIQPNENLRLFYYYSMLLFVYILFFFSFVFTVRCRPLILSSFVSRRLSILFLLLLFRWFVVSFEFRGICLNI